MPCEHYKNALTEAAASAVEPRGELRAHLETCVPCRATFAAEQSLFYSIDMGLQVHVNSEVPATLLPRVRAKLNEETSAARNWSGVRFAFAVAATLAIAFLSTQIHWRFDTVPQPVNVAVNKVSLPSAASPPQNQKVVSVPSANEHALTHTDAAAVKHHVPNDSPAPHNPEPEVLVPRDQEILLANYQQQWQAGKHPPIAAYLGKESFVSLEIAPIQIAELDVKLMAEQQGQ